MVRAWPAESRWLLAQQRQPGTPAEPAAAPQRPALQEVSQFMLLEREVELEYRPRMLQALPNRVKTVADSLRDQTPTCERCRQPMKRHDAEPVSWMARCGVLSATVERYRCPTCQDERRPLLDRLGVEPGRVSGSLARLLALLAVVAPYTLAAQLAWLLLGVRISPSGVWKVVQRLGESAVRYSEGMSRYHGDSRSVGASTQGAPPAVVLSVDGSMLGMQVRPQRRRRRGADPVMSRNSISLKDLDPDGPGLQMHNSPCSLKQRKSLTPSGSSSSLWPAG